MSGMISLGEDLEEEILVRLLGKSLMRFKCVQRSWNLLFKSPYFVARQMYMQSNNHHLMTVLHHNLRRPPYITLLSSDSDDPTPTHIPFTSLFPNPDNDNNKKFLPIFNIYSYGNCNGIFCLHDNFNNHLILWNPTTREVHTIPPPLFPFCQNDCGGPTDMFGFGNADHPKYNTTTNDLKVVYLFAHNFKNRQPTAQIYSLSTKSWTLIDGPDFRVFPSYNSSGLRRGLSKYNTLVNGVYHWIMGYSFDVEKGNILCFDFSNNRFSRLRGPISNVVVFHIRWEDIAEINGSLAYVMEYDHDGPERMGIWVMGQGGWAKKYSIGPIGPRIQIRGMWKDGAQVLGGELGQLLTSYDHDGNSVHQFQIKVPSNYLYSFLEFDLLVCEYLPSIVPLSM